MWNIEKIKSVGFKLVSENKGWCHFRGHGFDVFINLSITPGDLFNFHSYKNSFKGNFRIKLVSIEELKFIVERI